MVENDKPVLIYATFPNGEVAGSVADWLVEQRLAACVNIIPGMTSVYRWEGKLHHDDEIVAIIKTRGGLCGQVVGAIRSRHPYTNPAILVLQTDGGSEDFIHWIAAQTGQQT